MKKKVWSFSLIIFLVCFLVFFSYLTPKQALSSQIEGIRAPLYWSVYEYCFTTDGFIPEEEWEANINWVEDNFKDYGYNTICIDGWGDVSSFNKNGGTEQVIQLNGHMIMLGGQPTWNPEVWSWVCTIIHYG
jgi:hypothetical protein